MLGLTILIGFAFLGEFLSIFLNLPLPGNVVGLIIFIGSLFLGIIKLDWVESASSVIVRHLAFFFIPIVVAIITVVPTLLENIFIIIVGVTLSTMAVLLTAGWTVKAVIAGKFSREG